MRSLTAALAVFAIICTHEFAAGTVRIGDGSLSTNYAASGWRGEAKLLQKNGVMPQYSSRERTGAHGAQIMVVKLGLNPDMDTRFIEELDRSGFIDRLHK